MRRSGASAWIACTALCAGGAIVLVRASPERVGALPSVVPTGAGELAAPAGELALPHALEPLEPEEATARHPSPPAAPLRALEELEHLLSREPFDDASFVRAARAFARELDPLALAAAFSAGDSSARLVAAAELARARGDVTGVTPELPRTVTARLDAVARGAPGPLGDAAARSVIALGTPADAAAWTALLLDDSAELGERAARALACARGPEAALGLADVLGQLQDPVLLARATVSLAEIAARLDEASRAELAAELALLADDPSVPQAEQRVRVIRAQLEPRNGPDPGATLLDAGQPPELRLAAAESLARAQAPLPPALQAEALATLRSALGSERPSASRRRALYALSTLASPEGAADVALSARSDPDPTVRAAALRALRAFEPELRTRVLCAAATDEREPAVRAVVASELARLARVTARD